jgi:P-type Cu+ transporter
MACCVLVAFFINKLITTCETLNIGLDIQYNESFDFGPLNTSSQSISKKVAQDPYGMQLTKLSLTGLTCAACVSTISYALERTPGVEEVKVSLQLMSVNVYHDVEVVSVERLREGVEELGYGAEVGGRDVDAMVRVLSRQAEMKSLRGAFTRGMVLLILLLGAQWMDEGIGLPLVIGDVTARWVSVVGEAALSIAIQLSCAGFIYRNALTTAKTARVNMDTLVALSNILGMLLSATALLSDSQTTYFTTTAGLTVVVLGGRYLDALSRKKSAISLTSLYSSHASSALVRRRDGRRGIPASLLKVGDEIAVTAYTIVPVDCYVLRGVSQLDESIITGESRPVTKTVGALLKSGSRNGNGELLAVVYKDQEESTLSAMIGTISEATKQKASVQGRIDGVMLWFVVGVLCLTGLRTGLGWYWHDPRLPLSMNLDVIGRRAMAMLMAACPCAIGLSVPSAIMAGIDAAWQRGILITEGVTVMERLRKVTCVVLDKTGTLTEGTLRVENVTVNDKWSNDWTTFCFLLCAAEEPGAAVHPAGQAIFEHFLAEVGESWLGFKGKSTTNSVEEVPGQGVFCSIDSTDRGSYRVCLGNEEMMQRYNIEIPSTRDRGSMTSSSVVHVAIDEEYVGSINLSDTARSDAAATLAILRDRGLKLHMLTGDTNEEAQRISASLQIPLLAAKATPEDKLAHIRGLQQQGETVLMVGDGLNDSIALAAADVGVMISTNRRCATLGGNVLILSPKLAALADLLDVTEHTMKMVASNLMWAFSYNIVALALAMGLGEPVGLTISPTIGAMLMSVSSVSIAFRSMSMRKQVVHGPKSEKG